MSWNVAGKATSELLRYLGVSVRVPGVFGDPAAEPILPAASDKEGLPAAVSAPREEGEDPTTDSEPVDLLGSEIKPLVSPEDDSEPVTRTASTRELRLFSSG